MTKRKSFAEAAKSISQAPPSPVEKAAVEYRKFTVPLRSDQIREIDQLLARLALEHEVKVTKALLIRLAIDEVLAELEEDPDAVLHRLYRLEQQELADHDERRVSMSRGLEEHLRDAGAL